MFLLQVLCIQTKEQVLSSVTEIYQCFKVRKTVKVKVVSISKLFHVYFSFIFASGHNGVRSAIATLRDDVSLAQFDFLYDFILDKCFR